MVFGIYHQWVYSDIMNIIPLYDNVPSNCLLYSIRCHYIPTTFPIYIYMYVHRSG